VRPDAAEQVARGRVARGQVARGQVARGGLSDLVDDEDQCLAVAHSTSAVSPDFQRIEVVEHLLALGPAVQGAVSTAEPLPSPGGAP
jgi:hypothetical protein